MMVMGGRGVIEETWEELDGLANVDEGKTIAVGQGESKLMYGIE